MVKVVGKVNGDHYFDTEGVFPCMSYLDIRILLHTNNTR
jgi:hypothetical protein